MKHAPFHATVTMVALAALVGSGGCASSRPASRQNVALSVADKDIFDAIHDDDLPLMIKLLRDHPDLVFSNGCNGGTPLHFAAADGDKIKVKLLLAYRANINAPAEDGETPLSWAAMYGHKAVVEYLLANGADVNAKGRYGWTPLHHAAGSGNRYVVGVMLAHKAEVNAKDNQGTTPLNWAAGYAPDVVELLLAHNALADIADANTGRTPLHSAAASGNKDVVGLYLGKKVETYTKERSYGATSMTEMELLLSHKANVNAKDLIGQTPLHCAAESGDPEVVRVLLAHKAEINAMDIYGRTPLRCALLAHTAEGATDIYGRTPLRCAAEHGHKRVVKLLRQYGGHE